MDLKENHTGKRTFIMSSVVSSMGGLGGGGVAQRKRALRTSSAVMSSGDLVSNRSS